MEEEIFASHFHRSMPKLPCIERTLIDYKSVNLLERYVCNNLTILGTQRRGWSVWPIWTKGKKSEYNMFMLLSHYIAASFPRTNDCHHF